MTSLWKQNKNRNKKESNIVERQFYFDPESFLHQSVRRDCVSCAELPFECLLFELISADEIGEWEINTYKNSKRIDQYKQISPYFHNSTHTTTNISVFLHLKIA